MNRRHELVIGGYRIGDGGFANLAVGYYDDWQRLIFRCQDPEWLHAECEAAGPRALRKLEAKACPFDNLPQPTTGRWGEGLTVEAMPHYRWVRPELVAEVEFREWTPGDQLRHSRFVALRDDKDPREVRKEC